MEAGVLSWR